MAHIRSHIFLLLCTVVLAAIKISPAVDYSVTNEAASTRFSADIGDNYSKRTMDSASKFIQQSNPTQRKDVQRVAMFIDDMDGVAYTSNDEIHVSGRYIQGFSGNVKTEITGVLYHEMRHVWQWDGNGNAPGGLIEGIADYVRLKAGYAPSHWVKPGQGDRWDEGYDVTARFLDYCNTLRGDFVAELNKKMRDGYSDGYFLDLLGMNVHQLWTDYKTTYTN